MTSFRSFASAVVTVACIAMLYSCGGGDSTATLKSIEVTPSAASAAAGTSTQLTATGIYSDGGHQALTYQVKWTSSNSAVANVTAGGVANAVAPGSATVSASLGSVSGSNVYTVSAAVLVSLEVTPSRPSVASGTSLQFRATGIFSDNSTQNLTTQVLWSSSNPSAATVSSTAGSNGLVTTTSVGSVVISASSGTISGNTTLTITPAVLTSIEVTPPAPTLPKGLTLQLAATGVFSDNSKQDLTSQVVWVSSAPAVAPVSAAGVVTADSVGQTTMTASLGAVTSVGIPVTVSAAVLVSIQVTPPTSSIANGLTAQFSAIGIYTDNSNTNLTTTVTWSPSNAVVATISNAAGSQGLATSLSVGTTSFTATSGVIVSNAATLTVTPATLVSIAVTPPNPSVANGLTQQFTATGTYTDHTTQNVTTSVLWGAPTSTVATISNATGSQGLATSAGVGITSITATLGTVIGSTSLTVTAATLVSIQVTASNYTIAGIGQTQQFIATGTYTDKSTQNLTAQVTWSPTNGPVATISNAANSQGLATSIAVGMTTFTATLGAGANAVAGSADFMVTAPVLLSIQVTPINTTVFSSQQTQQMIAMGTYNDSATNPNHPAITTAVTWTSSNPNVVMSNMTGSNGIANFSSAGSTMITASLGAISGSTMLTIATATLATIQITESGNPFNNGNDVNQKFVATGTDNDMVTTVDLTNSATWTTTPAGVLSFTNPNGMGVATWQGLGTTSVTASFGGITSAPFSYTVAAPDSMTVTETPATATTVIPTSYTIAGIGVTQQFVANGTYANFGAPLTLTNLVSWTSSDTTVASITTTGAGTPGLATTVGDPVTTGSGSTTSITASWGGVSGSTNLVVTQSFGSGNNDVYTKVLSTTYVVGSTHEACSGCHTSTGVAASTWYATTAGATYSTISGDGYLSGTTPTFDICAHTPAGMPSYMATTVCSSGNLLQQWLSEGAPQ